jgi:DNA-binding NtrC family response regulator
MATILVIDDEAQVRATMRRVLERYGYAVAEAANGREALKAIASTSCDLVITDINMPEMDGIEVIMALSERQPGLPIIAISGGGRLPKDLLLASADMLGAVTTLAKPFDIPDLIGSVERALAEKDHDGDSTAVQ